MLRSHRLHTLFKSTPLKRFIAINSPIPFTPKEYKPYSKNDIMIAMSGFHGGFDMGPDKPSSDPDDPKNPKNIITKYYKEFKLFMKRYGWIGAGTYWCIWSSTFAGFYFAFESGLVDYHTWQFLHILENYYVKCVQLLGMDTDLHPINSKTESLLVAFAAAKITKPIQWCMVFGLTPIISQKLGYTPVPETTMKDKVSNKIKNVADKVMDKINKEI
jgi:hypothetical protein